VNHRHPPRSTCTNYRKTMALLSAAPRADEPACEGRREVQNGGGVFLPASFESKLHCVEVSFPSLRKGLQWTSLRTYPRWKLRY
jgi:hypothetical protein